MLSDEYLSIDTPENVAFGYQIAGIGSRFLAAFIDTLVIFILQIIVNLTLIFLMINLFGKDSVFQPWLLALFGLVGFAFMWGYYIFFEMSWNGQSLGKRKIKLRVIRTDGTPITLTESIIRNLIRLVDFLPFYYGIGVITMFVNEKSRRLGDLAAGTLVVHDKDSVTLESLAKKEKSTRNQIDISERTRSLPLERLTNQDLLMIEDYLQRRYELSNSETLANRLLIMVFERLEQPVPQVSWLETETLLSEILQASQDFSDE